jgi:hypothetical protein
VARTLPEGWSEAALVQGTSVANRAEIPPASVASLIASLVDRGLTAYFAIANVMGGPERDELVALGIRATRIWTVHPTPAHGAGSREDGQDVFAPARETIVDVVQRWWTDDLARFVVVLVAANQVPEFEADLPAGYALLERCAASAEIVLEHRSHCTILRLFTNTRSKKDLAACLGIGR